MRKVKLREVPEHMAGLGLDGETFRVLQVFYNTDQVLIEHLDLSRASAVTSVCFTVPGYVLIDVEEIVVLAAPRCECGSTAVGSPAHSRWCPKHE